MISITNTFTPSFGLNVICPNIGTYQKTPFQFNIEKQKTLCIKELFLQRYS